MLRDGVQIEFGILGPLEVKVDGKSVKLGGRGERALLGTLLLDAGETVALERLVDDLWGEAPPASARHLIHVYVSRLRRGLGEPSVITTRPPGYAVELGAHALDATTFERLLDEGRRAQATGSYQEALGSFDGALALWRGSALADLDLESDARIKQSRLDELRVVALEERISIRLMLGQHGQVVPELEQAVASNPLRELLRAQLMLALYRCGRQAEALDRYREGRRLLVEELGIEPGPELRALEASILRHDPSLDAPAPEHPGTGASPGPSQPTIRRRGKPALVALTGAVVAASILLAIILSGGGSGRVIQSLPPRSVGAVDARTGEIVGYVRTQGVPAALAVDPHDVWVGDGQDDALLEVDPKRLQVRRRIRLASPPHQLTSGDGSVWVANGYSGTLSRYDTVRMSLSRPFRPEPSARGRLAVAYGSGGLWVGSQDDVVTHLDGRGRVLARIGGIVGPENLAVGPRSVWVAETGRVALARVDIPTHRRRSIPIGGRAESVAIGFGSVWAVTPDQDTLWRIDPRTNAVTAAIVVGPAPTWLTVAGRYVWVASEAAGTLTQVDPGTGKVVRTRAIAKAITGLAPGGDRVWASAR
jgi:DNA-binding SARP family transcriptional activator/DNA-binding beta-propeller fold protein YncE